MGPRHPARTGQWAGAPAAQVAENLLHHPLVTNHGDHAHRGLTDSTAQRAHVPDPQNQVPGGGMGMRGGAVCHIRAISAGVRRAGKLKLGKQKAESVRRRTRRNDRKLLADTKQTPPQYANTNKEHIMNLAKLNSLGSRLFFVAALVLFAIAVLERAARVMGCTILQGSYTAGRMLEFSALLVIFVIALLLRQIREELRKNK